MPTQATAPDEPVVLVRGAIDTVFRLAAVELVRRGASDGASFRHVRKALTLRAVDVAAMLDVAAETVSAWETGKRPVDRGAWLALGALMREACGEGPTVTEHAQALAAARAPSREPIVLEYPQASRAAA